MKIYLTEETPSINLEDRVSKIIRLAETIYPPGISSDLIEAEGDILIGLSAGVATRLAAPTVSGLTLVSDMTVAGLWKLATAATSGGGSLTMTNKSGSNQVAGTVVIMDADYDAAFNTTTVKNDRRLIGVLGEDIDNDADGEVKIHGSGTVKVTGNVSRGQWLIPSATEGRAEAASSGYSRPPGAIGMATSEYTGGGNGTVDALIDIDMYLGASSGTGYVFGGGTPTTSTQINNCQKTPYATETCAALASGNLSLARFGGAGGQSTTIAYILGGTTGSASAVADKMPFATETTAAQTSANLSTARGWRPSSPCSSTAMYVEGGFTTTQVVTADKMPFATETTAAQATANLSAARYSITKCASSTNGYSLGGIAGSSLATADKTVFSTDTTAAQASANLSVARHGGAGLQSTLNGYVLGGFTTTYVATADKMPFSTETTAAQTSANLTAARYDASGVSSSLAGYAQGGYTTGVVSTADKMPFSTDTTAAQASANLVTACYFQAGCWALN